MKLSFARLAVIAPAFGVLLIVVATVAFSVGFSNGANGAPQSGPATPGAAASASAAPIRGNPGLGAGTANLVTGTVASKTTSAIVVTTLAGQTVTVNVSASTTYSTRGTAAATFDTIAVGNRIVAQGTRRADGSLDATRIQVGVGGRGFGGGDGRGRFLPAPSATPLGPSI